MQDTVWCGWVPTEVDFASYKNIKWGMLQTQVLGTSFQFSVNLHSYWFWFDGIAIPISSGSLSQAFCLFHNTSSAFCPPLSAQSSLHVVRFGGQKNSIPFIKKLMLLQTIFLALAPKISYWDIASKPILIDHYPVIFFLWPQFQMFQGCLLWSRSCMNISAYILKNAWTTKLEGNFRAIQCS